MVAGLILATAPAAVADPTNADRPYHIKTDGGSHVDLPPGYFLDESAWQMLDDEVRRLQERETRLAAENDTLRKEATNAPPIGLWATVAAGIALLVGFAAGHYIDIDR